MTGDVSIGRTISSPSVSIMPLIGISSPTEGATYQLNSVINATFQCQPLVGGCGSATDPNNTPIDTSTFGAHTFSVTTVNATSTIHYSVVAAPTIVSGLLGTDSLAPSGGPVTLSAHVTDADTCSLTFEPPIPSPPTPWDCSGASSLTHTTFVVPPNATPTTISEKITFTATASYSDGSSTAIQLATFLTRKGYDYYQAQRTLVTPSTPTSLSCPTATFCAQSGSKGYVGTITPVRVTWLHQDQHNTVNAVSCVSGPPIFCLAVDAVGRVMYFNGNMWSLPKPIQVGTSPNLTGVSCTQLASGASKGCIVVSSDSLGQPILSWAYSATLHRAVALTNLDSPATSGPVVFISCWATTLSAKNCALLNSSGRASYWSGGSSWSAPTPLFSDNGTSEGAVTSLSCSSDGVCLAGDSLGGIEAFSEGHPFSIREPISTMLGSMSISCVLDLFCFGGDAHGNFFQRTSGPTAVPGALPSSSSAVITARVKVRFYWDRSCQGQFTTAHPTTCTAVTAAGGKEYVISGPVTLAP